MMTLTVKAIILLCMSTFIVSCSTRQSPAPVVSLNTHTEPVARVNITGNEYYVQRGDTLFAIAWYSGNDYRTLARLNNISTPYVIYPGQKIQLTSSTASVQTHNRATSNTNKKVVDKPKNQAYSSKNQYKTVPSNKTVTTKTPNETPKIVSVAKPKDDTWLWPAKGTWSLSTIGKNGRNRGIDIAGSKGSAVIAAADGVVVYAGNALKGYGNLIIIKHHGDLLSAYAHNDEILVNEQATVKKGSKIATMGNSGSSTVKLHFEVRKKGRSLDPLQFLQNAS